jgi:hypothetical protein
MTKEIAVVEKEIKEYRSQVSFVQKGADSLTITSPDDMAKASDLLVAVGKVEKAVTERKEAITRPLMTALASARDLFKPLEVGYAEAKKTIKGKMLDYSVAEEERINKEKERVEKRVEKGTMRVDTAVKKLEGIGNAPTSFSGGSSKSSLRTVTKVRVVDESLLPREYLVPDMQKIQEAVLKQKLSVPGTETYEEKSIVGSSR